MNKGLHHEMVRNYIDEKKRLWWPNEMTIRHETMNSVFWIQPFSAKFIINDKIDIQYCVLQCTSPHIYCYGTIIFYLYFRFIQWDV